MKKANCFFSVLWQNVPVFVSSGPIELFNDVIIVNNIIIGSCRWTVVAEIVLRSLFPVFLITAPWAISQSNVRDKITDQTKKIYFHLIFASTLRFSIIYITSYYFGIVFTFSSWLQWVSGFALKILQKNSVLSPVFTALLLKLRRVRKSWMTCDFNTTKAGRGCWLWRCGVWTGWSHPVNFVKKQQEVLTVRSFIFFPSPSSSRYLLLLPLPLPLQAAPPLSQVAIRGAVSQQTRC